MNYKFTITSDLTTGRLCLTGKKIEFDPLVKSFDNAFDMDLILPLFDLAKLKKKTLPLQILLFFFCFPD